MAVGTSLAVQLLGLHASTAGGMVPSLGGLRSFLWGLSSHMLCGMAKKKKKSGKLWSLSWGIAYFTVGERTECFYLLLGLSSP